MDGQVVHSWEWDCKTGEEDYLLENRHLLWTGFIGSDGSDTFYRENAGGRNHKFSWDGKLFRDYERNSDENLLHHDMEVSDIKYN